MLTAKIVIWSFVGAGLLFSAYIWIITINRTIEYFAPQQVTEVKVATPSVQLVPVYEKAEFVINLPLPVESI